MKTTYILLFTIIYLLNSSLNACDPKNGKFCKTLAAHKTAHKKSSAKYSPAHVGATSHSNPVIPMGSLTAPQIIPGQDQHFFFLPHKDATGVQYQLATPALQQHLTPLYLNPDGSLTPLAISSQVHVITIKTPGTIAPSQTTAPLQPTAHVIQIPHVDPNRSPSPNLTPSQTAPPQTQVPTPIHRIAPHIDPAKLTPGQFQFFYIPPHMPGARTKPFTLAQVLRAGLAHPDGALTQRAVDTHWQVIAIPIPSTLNPAIPTPTQKTPNLVPTQKTPGQTSPGLAPTTTQIPVPAKINVPTLKVKPKQEIHPKTNAHVYSALHGTVDAYENTHAVKDNSFHLVVIGFKEPEN